MQVERVIYLAERLIALAEKRWGQPEETPHAEVFKRGEKPAPAESKAEYEKMPYDGPGRFSALVGNPARGTEAGDGPPLTGRGPRR
jgi:hypothetical protein